MLLFAAVALLSVCMGARHDFFFSTLCFCLFAVVAFVECTTIFSMRVRHDDFLDALFLFISVCLFVCLFVCVFIFFFNDYQYMGFDKHQAAASGDVLKVNTLLRHGAEVDLETRMGHTALTWASSCGWVCPLGIYVHTLYR